MKKSDLSRIWNYILDFVWPKKCLGCNKEGSFCCPNCLGTLKTLDIDYQAWDHQDDFYFDSCLVSFKKPEISTFFNVLSNEQQGVIK